MKKISVILSFSVLLFTGCGVLAPVHKVEKAVAVHHGFFDKPDSYAPDVVAQRIPATVAASASPVASAVSKIVHAMEIAGLACLCVAGLLFYFGQIIPGVKLALAGIALPVSAVWFNYHYGQVIAGILIASACGFLWAVIKKHPEWLREIEARLRAEIVQNREVLLSTVNAQVIPSPAAAK